MAEIALVAVAEIGASGIGFEQGNRITPMTAGGTSSREGVERREGREIERGDRRGQNQHCELAAAQQPLCAVTWRRFAGMLQYGLDSDGKHYLTKVEEGP